MDRDASLPPERESRAAPPRESPRDARRRVWRFLSARAGGASAVEIASEVLRIRGISEAAGARVVRGLLDSDDLFVETHGVWRLADVSRAGEACVAEPPPEWDALPPPSPDELEDPRVSAAASRRRKRVGRVIRVTRGTRAARVSSAADSPTAAAAADAAPHPAPGAASAAHLDRLIPPPERIRLPRAPGVYLFRARNGRPLYVGKAKDLRRRILSHFRGAAAMREAELHDAAARITIEVLGSEAEALLRELDLITRHAPRFNTQRNAYRGQDAKRVDTIVILPTAAPSRARVFVIRADGAFLSKDVARRRGRAALRPLVAFLRGAAPRARSRNSAVAAPAAAAALAGILVAWQRANRDHVTVVDPRRFTRDEELLRVLEEHLADAALFHERSIRV